MPKTKKAPQSMTMPDITKKAKKLGIAPGKMVKADLIHAIQQAEGCTPCYGTTEGYCESPDCCFIVDCVKIHS